MVILKTEEEQRILQAKRDGNQTIREVGFLIKTKNKKDGKVWFMYLVASFTMGLVKDDVMHDWR